jgi:hypothetical protein
VLNYWAVWEDEEGEACITDLELARGFIASLLKERKLDIEKQLLCSGVKFWSGDLFIDIGI